MMTDAVALAKERSAAKTAGFWYKFKIGVAVFLKYFSLIFVAFMMLLPLVSCFVTAAKTDKEYQSTSVMDMPKNWFNFDNYVQAFVASNMAVAFRNSIIVVVVVLVVTTIIGTMLAYVLSRFQFPGNGLIRGMFALAALLPGIAMQVALYKMMVNFHAVNTMWGYIVMMCGTDVISIYVFIQFFENISTSLDEAAIMDGASYFTVYYKILLPLLNAFGIDLLQFGIVMSFNLCIGLVTPPVGLCLLLCNQTGETRLSHSLKAMMPMLLISIIVLFLITYVSPLTTLLPSIMAG